jgi:uncharacterized protein (TIGR00156 family)
MRNIALFLILSALSIPAFAAFEQNPVNTNKGGFAGPGATAIISTVAQAKSARDDARCELIGNIIEQLSGDDDLYLFRDSTGEITIELDDDLFKGRTVTPQNQIRIYGEVDNEAFEKTQIDVKKFDVLN